MRVRLETIGCRLNIGEMEALARALAAAGHRIVGPGDAAELCVLNTCTVTATAARKSRHAIHQLRRTHPGAALVVTGCYAALEEQAATAAGAHLVVSNEAKDDLPELLAARGLLGSDGEPSSTDRIDLPGPSSASASRTRAFVKVQDGCNNRCTFCIVTVARGAGRSRPAGDVVAEVRALEGAGYREAVLSGVHLGSYGHDHGDVRGLERLVRRLLEETGINRLRLSSLEPWDLDERFFELFADARLQPHLHLPLQSGCAATLRRMARKTSPADFARLVAAARAAVPDLAVSTDIIVGFPGESEEEFASSLAFTEELAFSRLHVFRFSRREGTPAARMPHQVKAPTAAERSRRMHELGARLERSFQDSFLGRSLPVLWEEAEEIDGGGVRWYGLTPNYLRVVLRTPAGVDLANRVTMPTLVRSLPGAVECRAAESLQAPPAAVAAV